MTPFEMAALTILAAFYASFFLKMIIMRRRGIDSNLLGKGDKPPTARRVELWLKAITYSGAVVQVTGVLWSDRIWGLTFPMAGRSLGLLLAAAGTAVFIAAMAAMKTNWRSGYDRRQNTSLVVAGPYKISRTRLLSGSICCTSAARWPSPTRSTCWFQSWPW